MPSDPAIEKESGREDITLLPRYDFIHKTTPKVIRNSDTSNKTCCQTKESNLSFVGTETAKFIFLT